MGMLNKDLYANSFKISLHINCMVNEWGPDGEGKYSHSYDLDTIYTTTTSLDTGIIMSAIDRKLETMVYPHSDDMEVCGDSFQWNEIQDVGGNPCEDGIFIVNYVLVVLINGVLVVEEELLKLLPGGDTNE